MNFVIVFLIIPIIACGIIFYLMNYKCKPCCNYAFNGFPRMNDIEVVQDEDGPVKGDFYIKCEGNANPFAAFEIFRIDDVRQNLNGESWVQITTPVVTQDYELGCETHCLPAISFIQGKQKVRPIVHKQTLMGKLKNTVEGAK